MAEQVMQLQADVLKIHPRNTEFFDDIDGKDYETFKQSIKDNGVITPIIVASDMTIISGHQRHKACLDLGIKKIPAIVREDLDDEDEKVRQLIAANFGRIKKNDEKFRKALVAYVELNGLKHGQRKDLKIEQNALSCKSQQEIADEAGISVDELKRLVRIEKKLTPDMQKYFDTGKITQKTALLICKELSKEEQKELLAQLMSIEDKSSIAEQINSLIENNKKLQDDFATKEKEYKQKIKNQANEAAEDKKELLEEIQHLQNKKPEKIEVVPDDYATLKDEVSQLKSKLEVQKAINESLHADELAELDQSWEHGVFNEHCIAFNSEMNFYVLSDERRKNMKTRDINKFIKSMEQVESTLSRIKASFMNKPIVTETAQEQPEDSMPESMRVTQEMLGNTLEYDDGETVSETTKTTEPTSTKENTITEIDSIEVREKLLIGNKDEWTLSKLYMVENNSPQIKTWRKIEYDLGVCDENNKLLLSYDNYVEIVLGLKCDLSNFIRLKSMVAKMIKNMESTKSA